MFLFWRFVEALEIGGPGVLVGALVASAAAAVTGRRSCPNPKKWRKDGDAKKGKILSMGDIKWNIPMVFLRIPFGFLWFPWEISFFFPSKEVFWDRFATIELVFNGAKDERLFLKKDRNNTENNIIFTPLLLFEKSFFWGAWLRGFESITETFLEKN